MWTARLVHFLKWKAQSVYRVQSANLLTQNLLVASNANPVFPLQKVDLANLARKTSFLLLVEFVNSVSLVNFLTKRLQSVANVLRVIFQRKEDLAKYVQTGQHHRLAPPFVINALKTCIRNMECHADCVSPGGTQILDLLCAQSVLLELSRSPDKTVSNVMRESFQFRDQGFAITAQLGRFPKLVLNVLSVM